MAQKHQTSPQSQGTCTNNYFFFFRKEDCELKMAQEQSPPGLTGIKVTGRSHGRQVLMVGPDHK